MESTTTTATATFGSCNYNLRSKAVKRIMLEVKELGAATFEYFARPLEDNIFEWHFTVRGPSDTPFENGFYHGRIILPKDYPMLPPSIIMLTPSGRFEVNRKLCLSVSDFHPETWQPSWSIRTVLLAIIAFMPVKAEGSIGSLEYTTEERAKLARLSHDWSCSKCGKIKTHLLDAPVGVVAKGEVAENNTSASSKTDEELAEKDLSKETIDNSVGQTPGDDKEVDTTNEAMLTTPEEGETSVLLNESNDNVEQPPATLDNVGGEIDEAVQAPAEAEDNHDVAMENVIEENRETATQPPARPATAELAFESWNGAVVIIVLSIVTLILRRLWMLVGGHDQAGVDSD